MARRDALVVGHLENISRAALEKYQHIIRAFVRNRHGVYALYRRGRLYYVGLASNLRSRLHAHLRDRHAQSWDRFAVYLTSDGQCTKELESLVLRIVRPKGNRVIGRFAESKNLLRQFGREIKAEALREVYDMLGRRRPRVRIRPGGKSREARTRPDLYGCFSRAATLRGTYLGKVHQARVRKNGTIRYGDSVYLSVSDAARAACKRPRNGWWFWHVKTPAGKWVRLREWVGRRTG